MKTKIINTSKKSIFSIFMALLIVFISREGLNAQVPGSLEKRVRIGTLQSHFTAYGFEWGWVEGTGFVGVQWPADYLFQDNAVIERAWVAAENFVDADEDNWDSYGVYFDESNVGTTVFPVVHEQIARFEMPVVYVDGIDITSPYKNEVDIYDESIIPDRIVNNIVNTRLGLTMRKRIFAFSQQYHDDYFIKEYTFINTGNVDYDDDIELNAPLQGVRIGWGVRYSTCREGATKYDSEQTWGKFSWVTKRGDLSPNDYPSHAGERITEANPIVEWLRCGFTWAGQSNVRTEWDNIGAPDINGNGRLCAPQHAGIVTIHVDKAVTDRSDDPYQPAVLGWHASDAFYPIADQLSVVDPNGMKLVYSVLSGEPCGGPSNGGTNRFYEDNISSITDKLSPWTLHNDIGGTSIWICYGPFDIPHGDSIQIVEAEAVNGLCREMCEQIGARWLEAYNNPSDTGPFPLPQGSIAGDHGTTTTNKDVYKNAWVYTGWDSIVQTFGRAKRNFDADYQIPQPPFPPPVTEVVSGGDRITISWTSSPSENEADFGGYRIHRAVGKPDTTYEDIFACGFNTDHPEIVHSYEDTSPVRGFAYYYYLEAFNDGSNNTSGETNPMGSLYSSRFYTRTTEPAFLRRAAGLSLKDIRVVPNPFNIKARTMQYPAEYDKIGFLNIPAYCTIKIYTERGDLIQTIEHRDGSGDEFWNSVTSSRQVVVSGVYIAYFEVTDDYTDPVTGRLLYKKGDNTYRKFVIIR